MPTTYVARLSPFPVAPEIQSPAAGLRMRADERMHGSGRRLDTLVLGGVETVPNLALQGVGGIVPQPQRADAGPQVRGQRVQHLVHVDETGVATPVFRHLQGVERARLRRCLDIGHVGVPRQRAVVEKSDRLPIFQHVRDDEYLRAESRSAGRAMGGPWSSSPKPRLNRIRSVSLSRWSRRRTTQCSSHARCTAARAAGASSFLRSSPRISAPMASVMGTTSTPASP